MVRAYIDTELWAFALKKAKEGDDTAIVSRFEKANAFLKKSFSRDQIYISSHQLHEIFHVLSFRGRKLPIQFTVEYIENLMKLENVTIVENSTLHFQSAMNLCRTSGIHIWDFLCVLPVVERIEQIYTCDSHFKNKAFTGFNKPIENPINFWMNI
jgi:predicted nucleic acid-binding protein